MVSFGREFFKLTGSGNDFIFVDATEEPPGRLAEPALISKVCRRGTGIGADGIAFLTRSDKADFRMIFHNSDGSEAAMCGNAALCAARLGTELGMAEPESFRFETGAGIIVASVRNGQPEIVLTPVSDLLTQVPGISPVTGELQIGFASVGVPHLVIRCADVATVDLQSRGYELRWHRAISGGANVNFVSKGQGGWLIRTFERGVEGETLACGTGAAAALAVMRKWGECSGDGVFRTASGCELEISLAGDKPTLRGEGRIVYRGVLGEL